MIATRLECLVNQPWSRLLNPGYKPEWDILRTLDKGKITIEITMEDEDMYEAAEKIRQALYDAGVKEV